MVTGFCVLQNKDGPQLLLDCFRTQPQNAFQHIWNDMHSQALNKLQTEDIADLD